MEEGRGKREEGRGRRKGGARGGGGRETQGQGQGQKASPKTTLGSHLKDSQNAAAWVPSEEYSVIFWTISSITSPASSSWVLFILASERRIHSVFRLTSYWGIDWSPSSCCSHMCS